MNYLSANKASFSKEGALGERASGLTLAICCSGHSESSLSIANNQYCSCTGYFLSYLIRLPQESLQSWSRFSLRLDCQTSYTCIKWKFESTILQQTLDDFGIAKSHKTAYHSQGHGIIERLNGSLLQMLRCFVEKQHDWKHYLALAMFAYRTAVHASTRVISFSLMFGRVPTTSLLSPATAFESGSYSTYLQAKFAELHQFVEVV